jgi:UDP-N-acetyl-D-mannosaminuronic acid dehydrogenase
MDSVNDVCVIGGAGRVGLPLSLICADCGLQTLIYDIDSERNAEIARGRMPFREEGANEMLAGALASGRLSITDSPEGVASARLLVMVIGTPVDEHLNPSFRAVDRVLDRLRPFLCDGQTLILRSTVFPGTTRRIDRLLREWGLNIGVAFCPERVAEGYSLREFRELPQIISGFGPSALGAARDLFRRFAPELIELTPLEAELCKLMTNSWRYIQFAIVNQFYMLASTHDVDFDRILYGCRHNYPRMAGMPGPGFAAGPCLVKDTMQLAAFSQNQFVLGHAAMLVNEGLPNHLVMMAKREVNLQDKVVAILGMAFKAGSDDPRDSLSYKLRKLLLLEARQVLCTDPWIEDTSFVPLATALEAADVLFVATPHREYRNLRLPDGKVIVDVWDWLREKPRGSPPVSSSVSNGAGEDAGA